MFCEECGHDLDANGICPICGYNANKSTSSAQPVGVQNAHPGNVMQSVHQSNMQQPNTAQNMQRPNMQQPYMQQPNTAQNMQRPNMQQPYMQQPNMAQNMQRPNMQQPYMQQPNMQQTYSAMPPYGAAQNPYGDMRLSAPATKKKKKKWPIILGICVAVIAIVIAIVFIIRSNGDDNNEKTTESTRRTTEERTTEERTTEEPTTETPPPTAESGTRTIMVYMVGSNLESDYCCATEDISEMVAAENDPNVQIILYTGGANKWYTPEISNNGNTYLLADDNELTCLKTEESKNMGDSATLTNFLQYCADNYPAEQFSLILWNHGGGPLIGYGHDEITQDMLSLKELSDALAASPFHDNNKLEWIGFDACLMATIETADYLSPYAKYMIASQEPEPGWGWDYSFISDISNAPTGAEIGQIIVDHYITTTSNNFNTNAFSYCDITMSVMDLSETDNVETALNDLFSQVSLDETNYTKYSRIRTKTKEIASDYRGEQSYDVIDLYSFAQNLESLYLSEAVNLENALNDLIVYSNTNEPNANGVSIYHPYNAKQYSAYYVPMYYQLGFAEEYAKYITAFSKHLTGDMITSDWDVASLIPYMTGYSLNFALQLNDSQAAAYQKAYYVISRADTEQEGNYVFVAMNTQVEMDNSNTLTADFNGDVIYVQNNTTGQYYEAMYTEQETTDEYTRYLLTAILYNDDIQGDDAMYAYFVLETTESNPQGTIIGCYPLMNYVNTEGAEVFPDRYEIDINDYTNIAFGSVSHEFTSNEDLTNFNEADWSDATVWYNTMPISDGFSTIIGGLYDNIPYYGMFVIEDTQGNRHCSNLVQIK